MLGSQSLLGKRCVYISGELNVCHREKLLGWSCFKFCQRISWASKSRSLCEMSMKSITNRDALWEAGEPEESTDMAIRKKDSLSDPPGSEIMKLAYNSTYPSLTKSSLLVYPFISAPTTCLDLRCLKNQLEFTNKVNREKKSQSSTFPSPHPHCTLH